MWQLSTKPGQTGSSSMPNELALPSALDLLDARLTQPTNDAQDLAQVLLVLQRLGVNKADLQIHIERTRAANEVLEGDDGVEDNCLLALDLVVGIGEFSLRWDPPQMASVYMAKCLDRGSYEAALPHALVPSDLLPPRPTESLAGRGDLDLVARQVDLIDSGLAIPVRADFFRVPKSAFTSRPAALLSFSDRLSYEAMGDWISHQLDSALPAGVLWPRRRGETATRQFLAVHEKFKTPYVVKTDISAFYEVVDHGILAVFLARYLGLSTPRVHALQNFLDAVMGSQLGLPQGPPASDLFASAFLLPVDLSIAAEGWNYVRYADDYMIGATSLADARRKLETIEQLLHGVGLRLSDEKTMIMKRSTFSSSMTKPPRKVEQIRSRVRRRLETSLLQADDSDFIEEELTRLGVDDQTLWDLLYHGTTTMEEVLESIRDRLEPTIAEAYAQLLSETARDLRAGKSTDDLQFSEKTAIEALTFVAAGGIAVDQEVLEIILQWFPRAAPNLAVYLQEIGRTDGAYAGSFCRRAIARPSHSDWTLAWLVHVLESRPDLIDDEVAKVLRKTISGAQRTPLAAVTAVRALAHSGQLKAPTWRRLFERVSLPLRAEMLFAAMAEPASFPWQLPALERGTGRSADK